MVIAIYPLTLPYLTLLCLRTCMIDRYAALNATTQEGDLAEFEFREKIYFSLRMYCTLGEIWIRAKNYVTALDYLQ